MTSILTSIKKLLGIAEDYIHFDPDIIMHINSVFSVLTQLGMGPQSGFSIVDETKEWTDFTTMENVEMIKSYMNLKVKILFDPPLSSVVMQAMKESIQEFEWRILAATESAVPTTID